MTKSELKYNVENTGSHFFERSSMKFFGDTMKNYGVKSAKIKTNYDENDNYVDDGLEIEVWELYRIHPVKHGLWSSSYFDKKTFERKHPKTIKEA